MANRSNTRAGERISLGDGIAELDRRIAEIEREQQSAGCPADRCIVLARERNALACRRTSMRQRLTHVNRYWTNGQIYEPSITILR